VKKVGFEAEIGTVSFDLELEPEGPESLFGDEGRVIGGGLFLAVLSSVAVEVPGLESNSIDSTSST
jgi:hypothetical protein